ncbi:MlaD family protein [Gordonia polyisoprenivorans]|uniref:MlaD family protein n=1 Tax=Gordonia polyisoprenivorans TaxID=84595 RepID=UPI000B99ECF7|nr:MlaD family protein [Gordonia polyisoprenivorans]OZC31350.1 mammalian cell entry protein [Gordonia polyisoprenivorans]WCB35886.1 MlaD family protein [Gordonia polyisoprenivorans]
MNRVRPTATAGFVLFVVAMLLAGWVTVQALDPSVPGAGQTFTARFTDVSGLTVGNDVRELGVRVGKVESISLLDDSGDQAQAQVRFTVNTTTTVYDDTQIAIRYLNLVGQRYLDLQTPAGDATAPKHELATTAVIPASRTIGSFDITEMFNGLRPLFGTLQPDQLNSLMNNILAVIEGRGPDVGSVLNQLRQLADVVSDRSTLIATVISQLGRVAGEIRYKSPQLNDLISRMGDAFGVLAASADKTQESMRLAARSLGPVRQLLESLDESYYGNYATVDHLLRTWVPAVNTATAALGRLPALIDALDATAYAAGQGGYQCGSGQAIPTPLTRVLLAGVPVVVCR